MVDLKSLSEEIAKINENTYITDAYVNQLVKAGFTIEYSKFSYWDGQPFVLVGEFAIPLMMTENQGDSMGICYRHKKYFLRELKEIYLKSLADMRQIKALEEEMQIEELR